MTTLDQQRQRDLVRDRFTRTAEAFGNFVLQERVAEAEKLANLVEATAGDRAVDLACGPGTLALRFARRVRWICGLDLTPAMLLRAKNSAKSDGLANLNFSIGDAQALPFPDDSVDFVVTSYSLHHIPDPARVIREMARVVRRGGRVGVIDVCAPEDAKAAELNNRIDRLRDPSHTRSLPQSEFEKLFAAAGLRVTAVEIEGHPRSFDNWLHVAGWHRGDDAYEATRRLMESTIPGDSAGFHPKFSQSGTDAHDSRPDIHMVNTAVYIAARNP